MYYIMKKNTYYDYTWEDFLQEGMTGQWHKTLHYARTIQRAVARDPKNCTIRLLRNNEIQHDNFSKLLQTAVLSSQTSIKLFFRRTKLSFEDSNNLLAMMVLYSITFKVIQRTEGRKSMWGETLFLLSLWNQY